MHGVNTIEPPYSASWGLSIKYVHKKWSTLDHPSTWYYPSRSFFAPAAVLLPCSWAVLFLIGAVEEHKFSPVVGFDHPTSWLTVQHAKHSTIAHTMNSVITGCGDSGASCSKRARLHCTWTKGHLHSNGRVDLLWWICFRGWNAWPGGMWQTLSAIRLAEQLMKRDTALPTCCPRWGC